MQTLDILKAIRDYGINAILVVAVIWMNSRMSDVEERLFDCFQHRLDDNRNYYPNEQRPVFKNSAILPKEIQIVSNEKN